MLLPSCATRLEEAPPENGRPGVPAQPGSTKCCRSDSLLFGYFPTVLSFSGKLQRKNRERPVAPAQTGSGRSDSFLTHFHPRCILAVRVFMGRADPNFGKRALAGVLLAFIPSPLFVFVALCCSCCNLPFTACRYAFARFSTVGVKPEFANAKPVNSQRPLVTSSPLLLASSAQTVATITFPEG